MVRREPRYPTKDQGKAVAGLVRAVGEPAADSQNNLEFTLRMQDFTELCRKRDTAGAIAYSRKNLAPWATTHMPQLQQAMTMLVFGERTGVNLYKVSIGLQEIAEMLMIDLDSLRPEPVDESPRLIQGDLFGAVRPSVPTSAIARSLCRTRLSTFTRMYSLGSSHAIDP